MAEKKKTSAMMQHEDNLWNNELDRLAAIFNKTNLEVAVKWGADVYTYKGKNVVSYGGFKNYFTIWFYNGVFLSDPDSVLVNAQEGKTKSLRQWRMTSMDDIDEKKILNYVNEAVEIEKKGLKLSPEKFQPLENPELLQNALDENSDLNAAFEKLTPGKQKEYILYLNEAKQEATKLKRLEKIVPMILDGKGLNDKYK